VLIMGENTEIEWSDHAFDPWIGCACSLAQLAITAMQRDGRSHEACRYQHYTQWPPGGGGLYIRRLTQKIPPRRDGEI
jgi:hypothetical protein